MTTRPRIRTGYTESVSLASAGFPAYGGELGIMKFAQIAKRIFLFALVNILVMTTITVILGMLRAGRFFPSGGLAGLAVFCLVWGFAGAFISLALSRVMAKWFMMRE